MCNSDTSLILYTNKTEPWIYTAKCRSSSLQVIVYAKQSSSSKIEEAVGGLKLARSSILSFFSQVLSFTDIKVSIFIQCEACNTACLWRREQRIVGTGQHLFREKDCWHHPSRTPASCLSAALKTSDTASLLIFFGNTWWQKGASSPYSNNWHRLFDSFFYPSSSPSVTIITPVAPNVPVIF